jgi:hypothetical protein
VKPVALQTHARMPGSRPDDEEIGLSRPDPMAASPIVIVIRVAMARRLTAPA